MTSRSPCFSLSLGYDLRPHGRQCHFTPAAFEDGQSQFVLELFDRNTQRRLAHETRLSRFAEMSFSGDRNKVTQLGERHGFCVSID